VQVLQLESADKIPTLTVVVPLKMSELSKLKQLAGINISVTGTEKAELQRQHNIQPGTPEWFQLWFSLPYLTGEKPVEKK
jgi:hypothetical protein